VLCVFAASLLSRTSTLVAMMKAIAGYFWSLSICFASALAAGPANGASSTHLVDRVRRRRRSHRLQSRHHQAEQRVSVSAGTRPSSARLLRLSSFNGVVYANDRDGRSSRLQRVDGQNKNKLLNLGAGFVHWTSDDRRQRLSPLRPIHRH